MSVTHEDEQTRLWAGVKQSTYAVHAAGSTGPPGPIFKGVGGNQLPWRHHAPSRRANMVGLPGQPQPAPHRVMCLPSLPWELGSRTQPSQHTCNFRSLYQVSWSPAAHRPEGNTCSLSGGSVLTTLFHSRLSRFVPPCWLVLLSFQNTSKLFSRFSQSSSLRIVEVNELLPIWIF